MAETFNSSDVQRVGKTLHDHWPLLLTEGIVLMVLGVAAVLVPPLAGLATTIFFGWLFLTGGAVGLVGTIAARRSAPGFVWSLLSALIAIAAGVSLIGWPLSGAVSLTLVLTVFLVADGFISIFLALEHRRHLVQRWIWLLLNGVIDLGLAGIIVAGLPQGAAWFLGLILGIDLIFGGLSLVSVALAARQAKAG